jgi:DNA polymerase-4
LPYASTVARHIRADIFRETNLTASAGVSVNKFLAKMASGANKPNGLTVILPENAETFVEQLPIEKFHGIGEVTATKMHSLGIRTGTDLKQLKLAELIQHFGKAGHYYYKIARGQDDRTVEPNRIRKSIGAETSFAKDLSDRTQMLLELEKIAQTVKQRIDQHQASGRTITLKVKFSDYQQITRSKTAIAPISELNEIIIMAKLLFEGIELSDVSRQAAPRLRSIRLLGISLSNLDNENVGVFVQLSLFEAFR